MLRHPYSLVVDQRCVSHPRAKGHLHLGHIPGVDQGLDEALWRRGRNNTPCTAVRIYSQYSRKNLPLVLTGLVGNLGPSFPGEVASFGMA